MGHLSKGTVMWMVLAAGLALVAARGYGAGVPVGGQDGITSNLPWMQPPTEFKQMQRQGFHEGVQGAIKDFDHHRDPDLERHKEYVHPKHMDRSYVPDYRDGYRRGYNDAYKHLVKTHGRAS
jgi:hypothetical protein